MGELAAAGDDFSGVRAVVAMVHVVDVEASARFYEWLGLARGDSLRTPDGVLRWQWMGRGSAHVMVARASGTVDAGAQAVLLYMYCRDVDVLRAELLGRGLRDGGRFDGPTLGATGVVPTGVVFERTAPGYMPKGEIRVHDPDGYCLLIGAVG
jgi:hypothetical protein